MFAHIGVTRTIIMENTLAQTQGHMQNKTLQYLCYIKTVEPHSPWSNADKGAIREIKHGSSR